MDIPLADLKRAIETLQYDGLKIVIVKHLPQGEVKRATARPSGPLVKVAQ